MHKATVETGGKPLAEPEDHPPDGGLRGQERGGNKHHNTRLGIPAEKKKHKLMTAIMLYVHKHYII